MILAVLQARVSSSRLPGKVLLPLLGKPMILRQIERISRAKKIGRIVLATSVSPEDQKIEELCHGAQIACFRGDLENVLDRFFQAALPYRPEHVVRLTGDCPLTDPKMIDRMIDFHICGDYDYSSNSLEPTFPDGLDVEVIRFSCLEKAWKEASSKVEKEHVTPFFYRHPEHFKIGILKNGKDLSDLRWTVDEPLDYELITSIYSALYPADSSFSFQDILDLLEKNPKLKIINAIHTRNEGLKRSLREESGEIHA